MITKPIMIRREFICFRDEFTCPITRDLLRDPWLAADGHSYERDAIEQWLVSRGTSPKTGQPLESRVLIPNHNLKRLIKDLINEGGEGLYIRDGNGAESSNGDLEGDCPYRFALVPQQVLILKCLGPAESEWNCRSFRISENGCQGGRRRPERLGKMDFMYFNDATVSRAHFMIGFNHEGGRRFYIKDCCSAGGTYLRIAFGVPKPMYPGLMIMLGKHQLIVLPPKGEGSSSSSFDEGGFKEVNKENSEDVNVTASSSPETSIVEAATAEEPRPEAVQWIGDELEMDNSRELVDELDPLIIPLSSCPSAGGTDDASIPETPLHEDNKSDMDSCDVDDEEVNKSILERTLMNETMIAQGRDAVRLKCFAPEGTPIQGNCFTVTSAGATLGRKQMNTIAFCHYIKDQVMGVDSSISGEHARVVWSEEAQCLQLFDGTEKTPSTNGTWFRLSGMYCQSEPYCLYQGMEILIGTVRFSVSLEHVIVEADARDYMEDPGKGSPKDLRYNDFIDPPGSSLGTKKKEKRVNGQG